jgi:hypothetical protein
MFLLSCWLILIRLYIERDEQNTTRGPDVAREYPGFRVQLCLDIRLLVIQHLYIVMFSYMA